MVRRSHRLEKMAGVYDEEILPVWARRFGRMLFRGLVVPPKSMVLDVGCRTGYPALELLPQLDAESRIIALESSPPLLDIAREKAGDLAQRRIFFRTEAATTKLAFADDVYSIVFSNLGLLERDDPAEAIKEFARVTRPGGQVLATLPLAGTYREFYDIYREVLTKNDQTEVLEKLEALAVRLPEADEAAGWMEAAGLINVDIEVEEFRLLFKSGREFFFAPVIEFGPLPEWKQIAGKGEQMQNIFWQIKESIDAYFSESAFEVTVKAACLRGQKRDPDAVDADAVDDGESWREASTQEIGTDEATADAHEDDDDAEATGLQAVPSAEPADVATDANNADDDDDDDDDAATGLKAVPSAEDELAATADEEALDAPIDKHASGADAGSDSGDGDATIVPPSDVEFGADNDESTIVPPSDVEFGAGSDSGDEAATIVPPSDVEFGAGSDAGDGDATIVPSTSDAPPELDADDAELIAADDLEEIEVEVDDGDVVESLDDPDAAETDDFDDDGGTNEIPKTAIEKVASDFDNAQTTEDVGTGDPPK